MAQVLQQAAGVQATADGSYEMFDYVISLREGIMDAWGGIIGAMKAGGKSKSLPVCPEASLTLSSCYASTIYRVDLPSSQYHLHRSESK